MAAVAVDYRVQGEGPPLYMVHGIGSRKVTWDGLMPQLTPYFTCVSYDLRGPVSYTHLTLPTICSV